MFDCCMWTVCVHCRKSSEPVTLFDCTFVSLACATDVSHVWPFRVLLSGPIKAELAFKTAKEMDGWSKGLLKTTSQESPNKRKRAVYRVVANHLRVCCVHHAGVYATQ